MNNPNEQSVGLLPTKNGERKGVVCSASFGEVARCRWCENTKPLADMAVASWKGREYNGVCRECMSAPDAEQREAAYLMRDLPNAKISNGGNADQ